MDEAVFFGGWEVNLGFSFMSTMGFSRVHQVTKNARNYP